MTISITAYNAICNLGNNIDTIYEQAISGNTSCFSEFNDYNPLTLRTGLINTELPNIDNKDFNLQCNKIILKNLDSIQPEITLLMKKYNKDKIGIIAATTNSGVEEFETTRNSKHYELGNPACFLREQLNSKGFYATVSTACSSGIKAFSLAKDLLENEISEAVIVVCVDTLAKVPVYGFNSLEVLTNKQCIPFSKNRTGMNIGEACAIFILEKDVSKGIKIMGIGESSDIYHPTTPDPTAKEAINAIKMALHKAQIHPEDVDYINTHGTGTLANDIMEANAIFDVFGAHTPVSSTKPMTGHCLGAAAGIETALCCKLLENFNGKLYPHVYDDEYDESLPLIKLVNKNEIYSKCNICLCNAFGFGGSNAILILGNNNE